MLYQANPSAWNTSFMMYACGVLSSLTLLGTLIVFSTLMVPFAIASYGFMQWTNPSLGILLRGNAAAVIMNNKVFMGL